MRGRDVFPQGVARERIPTIGARQLRGTVAQPVEPQPVARHRVQLGDGLDGDGADRRHLRDVERGREQVERRDLRRELAGHALLGQRERRCTEPLALGPAHERRQRDREPAERVAEELDRGHHRQRLAAVAQQPAAHALDQLSGLEVHRRLHVDRDGPVERFDGVPQRVLPDDRPGRLVGAHDVGARRAGLLRDAERERRAGPVDETVHQRGGDELAAQRVPLEPVAEPLVQRRGEVADEIGEEVGVVGKRAP